MINGRAIFSWPVSSVTINVAIDATDSDHQRLRPGGKVFFGGGGIETTVSSKFSASLRHRHLEQTSYLFSDRPMTAFAFHNRQPDAIQSPQHVVFQDAAGRSRMRDFAVAQHQRLAEQRQDLFDM